MLLQITSVQTASHSTACFGVLPNNGGLFVGRHVKRVEDEYWTRNNLCESKIEKFDLGLKANHLFSYHEIYK